MVGDVEVADQSDGAGREGPGVVGDRVDRIVDREVLVLASALGLGPGPHPDRHRDPEGDPHPERPAPPVGVDHEAAGDEADQAAHQRAGLVEAEHPGAPSNRVVVGEQRHGGRSVALDCADAESGGQQRRIAGGDATEHHAPGPDGHGPAEQTGPPQPVGQQPDGDRPERADHCHGGGERPDGVVADAELGLDPVDRLGQRLSLAALERDGERQRDDRHQSVGGRFASGCGRRHGHGRSVPRTSSAKATAPLRKPSMSDVLNSAMALRSGT